MRAKYVRRMLQKCGVGIFVMSTFFSGLILPQRVLAADTSVLVPIEFALKNTVYISNSVTMSGYSGSVNASVSGGINSVILKNGVDSGTSTTVVNGDLLSLKTTAPDTDGITTTVTVTVNGSAYDWLLTTASAPQLNAVAGAYSGYTSGNFNVSNLGASSYNIPIIVAPGSGKLQPSLSLNYNSHGGNGVLGIGWSLGGLSTITRCASTFAQDVISDNVEFDNGDKLCIDGQKLVRTTLTGYGANNTEYRTEDDSFSRIISYGSSGTVSMPAYFKVWTKSGLVMEYGNTADSKVEAQGRSDVLFWAVNRISDTNGNYMKITYTEDNANSQFLVNKIDYTGNDTAGISPFASVQFTYEDREDKEPKYLAGSKLALTKRLTNIKALVDGGVIREYRFTYQNDVATKKSQLTQLVECGSNPAACLRPTNFEWGNLTPNDFNFSGPGTGDWGGNNGGLAKNLFGDFDGDGKTDMMKPSDAVGDTVWRMRLSSKNNGNFSTVTDWNGHTGDQTATISGDFNADGRTDIAGYDPNGDKWDVCLSTGTNFDCASTGYWTGVGGNASQIMIGDFNGDGRSDIMHYEGEDANNWGLWKIGLSNGTNFDVSPAWQGHSGGKDDNFLGDFDGDGRTDIIGYSSGTNWHVCISTGVSFDCSFWSGHSGGHLDNITADFNGDGKTDIAGWTGNDSVNWDVCLSSGINFTCSYWQSHKGGIDNNRLGDFNGDGKTDMAGYDSAGQKWHVLMSTGSNFFAPGDVYWTGNQNPANMTVPGDFNGDGKTDFAAYTTPNADTTNPPSAGNWRVSLPGGAFPNLLAKITNGHGLVTTISYRPLTDNSIYTKGTDSTYPRYDMQAPLYVVSSYSTSNGNGGMNQFDYAYEGAQMNLLGRGFRGFRSMTVHNVKAGLVTSTTFERDFRYQGLPLAVETRTTSGTLINGIYNDLGLITYNNENKIFFPYVSRSVKPKYELDGSQISSTVTTTTYDAYGNPIRIENDYGAGFTDITENTYTNTIDASKWYLGRLTEAKITKSSPGQNSIVKTSSFEYDSNTGLLSKEEIEKNDASLRVTKTYARDNFGNINSTTVSGPNVVSRVNKTNYNTRGVAVGQTIDAAGFITKYVNSSLANPIAITDPTNLVTTKQYDSFGRLIYQKNSDGTQIRKAYLICTSSTACPTNAVYFIQEDVSGRTGTRKYFDVLDREIRHRASILGSIVTYKDTNYDDLGRVAQVSDPYIQGTTEVWTEFAYDTLSRMAVKKEPGNFLNMYTYAGLKTTAKNAKDQITVSWTNFIGQVVETRDANNSPMYFTYDSAGNLIQTRDAANNTTSYTYDKVGNKTSVSDPDLGNIAMTYNAYGELLTETDAKNQTTTYTYDKLGRVVTKTTPEGITTSTYDSKPFATGQLIKISGPNNYVQEFNYDGLGRRIETITKIDNVNYVSYNTFDEYSRVRLTLYPSWFRTASIYGANGVTKEVRNATDNTLLWQLQSMTARGRSIASLAGNGLKTTRSYDNDSGRITSIKTGTTISPTQTQDLAYTYDSVGNLISRSDLKNSLSETFSYDSLNRMTSSQVGSNSPINVTYDALGNITNKSDVGNYIYANGKPHAVSSVSGTLNSSYTYDANGNRLTNTGGSVTYTSANLPKVITKGSTNITYTYSPDNKKIKSVITEGSTTSTTIYVNGTYEKNTVGAVTKEFTYINAGGELIAINTKTGSTSTFQYIHNDHLGSPQTITHPNKSIAETLSFDSWGNRRTSSWTPSTTVTSNINRGYTGHEQLDEVGLIHMNGRIYDPVLGRFLSADPFIQIPSFSQNYNRYSYVLNNPLNLTDPSGFDLWDDFIDVFENAYDFVRENVIPLATGVVLGIAGFIAFGPVGAAAGFGFGSSFAGTLLNGGSIGDALKAGLTSGFISAATAYAFGTVGNMKGWSLLEKSLAHGVIGGAKNIAQGDDFGSGFASAFATKFFGVVPDTLFPGADQVTERVVTASIVGGTVSELTGGKFVNGAVTGAFSRLFNAESKRIGVGSWRSGPAINNMSIKYNGTEISSDSVWFLHQFSASGTMEGVLGCSCNGGDVFYTNVSFPLKIKEMWASQSIWKTVTSFRIKAILALPELVKLPDVVSKATHLFNYGSAYMIGSTQLMCTGICNGVGVNNQAVQNHLDNLIDDQYFMLHGGL